MADETTAGYPYVEDIDAVADFPGTMLDLVNAIQARLGTMASGVVTITPDAANTPKSVLVTFPAGRFPIGVPRVVAVAHTSIPADVNVSTNGGSAAAITIVLDRTSVTGTAIHWLAHYTA